jgi:hypothetical protein
MNLTMSLALGLSGRAINVDKSPPLFDVYEPPSAEESSSDTRHWRDSSLTRLLWNVHHPADLPPAIFLLWPASAIVRYMACINLGVVPSKRKLIAV